MLLELANGEWVFAKGELRCQVHSNHLVGTNVHFLQKKTKKCNLFKLYIYKMMNKECISLFCFTFLMYNVN